MQRFSSPNLDGLVRLSRREGVDVRPALLRVLTDLYVQERSHGRDAEQQYVELALHMLPQVDVTTRIAVATKLARYPLAPLPIRAHLLADIPAVADILKASETPAPAASGSENGWSEPVAEAPQPVARTQAVQPSRLQAGGLPLREADTLPGDRFLAAESAERMQIVERLEGRIDHRNPTVPAASPDAVERLERAAMAQDARGYAAVLQTSLRITSAAAARIAADPRGEALVVAAKAMAMPAASLHRVLLFLNPDIGRSVERVFALARLFDDVSAQTAMRLAADWRDAAARRGAARYAGVHADEGAPAAAPLMDNARRPAAARVADAARRREAAADTALRQRRS